MRFTTDEARSCKKILHTEECLSILEGVAKARKGIEHGQASDDELKALRYAYEVVNDVQAWSLPQVGENLKVRHKFGASYALDDHKQVSVIEEWITNHK